MTDELPFDPETVAQAAKANAEREQVQLINGHDISVEVLAPEFSDDAIGLRFSHQFAPSLRYVAKWGKWLAWDGKVWREDSTLRVYDLVRQTCRALSGEAKGQLRAQLTNGRTVAAVEKLIRSDRRHAATVEQWDSDPWLLNTPGGVIDLRTGDLLPHESELHMTKITAATPDGDCPMWLNFLREVTKNSAELMGYLQRASGYALTGLIREHALFFAYGTGGNGKGTFLNTIQAIMGQYAIVSPSETFMAKSTASHLTELARLQGARLVVAQETSDGTSLNTARVSAITGGDPITANFMRQDHFTFSPQFKLFMSGNHKPGLGNVTDAMKRRLNLIPFEVKIDKERADTMLADKLKVEWPGILRWMIDGCLWWQDKRLMPPEAVLVATSEYFEAEDAFAQWIEERCTTRRDDWNTVAELFRDWDKWAKAAGEFVGSQKRFSEALMARGFKRDKIAGHRSFRGIALAVKPSNQEGE